MKRKLEVALYILSTNFLPHMGEIVVAIEGGGGGDRSSSWYTCFHFYKQPDKAMLGLHYEPS